jgi:hypothetical protein
LHHKEQIYSSIRARMSTGSREYFIFAGNESFCIDEEKIRLRYPVRIKDTHQVLEHQRKRNHYSLLQFA